MKMPSISEILRPCIVVAFGLGVTSTAIAEKPLKENFSFDYTGFFIGACDGFVILNDGVGKGFIIEYFDKDGNTTHIFQHINYSQIIYYNSENTDAFLVGGPGELENVRVDFTDDQPFFAITGVGFKVTVPGYGVIFHQVGRTVFDLFTGEILFQAGPNDFSEENVAALCAALTP